MFRRILCFTTFLAVAPLTADVLIVGAPTRSTALDYAMQVNKGQPFSDIVIVLDPSTGAAVRYDVEFYQDFSSANADFVMNATEVSMSSKTRNALAEASDGYNKMDTAISNLTLDYRAVDLSLSANHQGYFTDEIKRKLVSVNEQYINQKLRQADGYIRENISWPNREVKLSNGGRAFVTIASTGGRLNITIHSVRDPAGAELFPRPTVANTDFYANQESISEMIYFLTRMDFHLSEVVAPPPPGFLVVFKCNGNNQCDVTLIPEKNKT